MKSEKKTKKLTDYNRLALTFHLPAFVLLGLITLIPLLYTLKLSFFNYQISQPGSENEFVGLANYIKVFTDMEFYHSIRVTFTYMLVAIVVEVIFGMLIALALNRVINLRRVLTSLTLIPTMVAPIVIGLMYSFFLNPQFGLYQWLVNTMHLPLPVLWTDDPFLALMMVSIMDIWEWTPYMGLVFLAGMQAIDGEYYEAARVDGATEMALFFKVTLPLMKPVMVTAILLRMMECFKKFDEPWILTGGGPGNATDVLDIFTYRQAFKNFNFSYAAAVCVILFLILIIIGRFYQHIVIGKEED